MRGAPLEKRFVISVRGNVLCKALTSILIEQTRLWVGGVQLHPNLEWNSDIAYNCGFTNAKLSIKKTAILLLPIKHKYLSNKTLQYFQ